MITLTTLPQATAQEVFDQVKNHLLTQNKKSEKGVMCVYKGPDGLKCAAGCLISDDEYVDRMDDVSQITAWDDLVSEELVPEAHACLITELQYIHDSREVEDWSSYLKKLAEKYNLNYE